MREKIRRRRKRQPRYGRIAIALLIFILIIALGILGINKNVKDNISEEIAENSQEPEVEIPNDITINLVAIGDIMCHNTNFKAAYNSSTGEYDFSPVFTDVAKYIAKADISIRKLGNDFCRRR